MAGAGILCAIECGWGSTWACSSLVLSRSVPRIAALCVRDIGLNIGDNPCGHCAHGSLSSSIIFHIDNKLMNKLK
jgi:hypothetical protein